MTSTTRAWYTVALLCAMTVISYLDRYIIALLADPIMAEFAITATDVGLLIGLGFGLVYALAGLPLAHWLDHGNRVRIVAFGVLLWSLYTASSGLAPDYNIARQSHRRSNWRVRSRSGHHIARR